MKVYLSKGWSWGPVHRFLYSIGLEKLAEFLSHRPMYVKIDKWDSWSADNTLSHIAVPLLKQLKATQHGHPMLDKEDFPEEMSLRGVCSDGVRTWEDYSPEQYKRMSEAWNLILDKMIWAHEQILDDKSHGDGFVIHEGGEWEFTPCEDNPEFSTLGYKNNDRPVYNWDAISAYHERVQEGLNLFGKYYRNLWD